MAPPPPVTPLQPHRGQHAGIIAFGLLAATIAVVWSTHRSGPSAAGAVDSKPRPAAAMPRAVEPLPLPPLELGPDVSLWVVREREVPRMVGGQAPVSFDEHRTHHVRMPVAGYLVKTRASSVGRVVRAGETIGTIYSPEVYFTTLSLLGELRQFRGQEFVDAHRIRLLRWGMRQEQVTQIEKAMRPSAELPIIARVTGRVVAEQGKLKQLIDPSAGDVFTITDPSYATIYVEIPSADADLIALGGPARVTIGKTAPRSATIGYISRSVERGLKTVRVDLHPYAGRMPPTETADVDLARTASRGLAVPETAVTRDGNRTFVYVARPGGELAEPRLVTLGPAASGFVLVAHGLAAGETVALPPR